ncbi:MAG: tetratricopeptide repeat protein [Chloroflexi bacterium]|nr:MAG: tetratricopeptide repeat protein [Chloroflexota bacterium]
MGRIEKTVFISYRRTNVPWALAIYQNLTSHGYDVFFDYQSIDSGNFEKVILENIKTRAHFLIILTPSALERCKESGDWLRREIETAMDEKRNIVPLMMESFDFGSPLVKEALTGKLAALNAFNGLRVYSEYFFEAMDKLRDRYMNVEVRETVALLLNAEATKITKTQKTAASDAAPVQEEQLTAQAWFERGYTFENANALDEALRCYTEAIRLDPKFDFAYLSRGSVRKNMGDIDEAIRDYDIAIKLSQRDLYYSFRGNARIDKEDFEGAIADHSKAIQLNPESANAYYFRGDAHFAKGDIDAAIVDYTRAIKFAPEDSDAYVSRGDAFSDRGDIDLAIKDYSTAIRLKPKEAYTYLACGNARREKGDLTRAIKDYSEAISLKTDIADVYIEAYYNRAEAWEREKDYSSAIADYQKYLELDGGERDGDQKEVEEKIKKLQSKLTRMKSTKKKSK